MVGRAVAYTVIIEINRQGHVNTFTSALNSQVAKSAIQSSSSTRRTKLQVHTSALSNKHNHVQDHVGVLKAVEKNA